MYSRREFLTAGAAAAALGFMGVGVGPRRAAAVVEQAGMADGFVDTIGVTVHVHYLNTPYGNIEKFRSQLANLGTRYLRTHGNYYTDLVAEKDYYDRMRALAADGQKFVLLIGRGPRGWGSNLDLNALTSAKLQRIKDQMGDAIAAWEGPNEPDTLAVTDWAARAKAYQQKLYSLVHSAPTIEAPVLGFALAQAGRASQVGDVGPWADYGGMHPYPGGSNPGDPGSIDNFNIKNYSTYMYPGRTTYWPTEAGYHNALNTASGHYPVSEAVAAKYVPRLYFEYYLRGFARTHVYEFYDEHQETALMDIQQHFGQVRYDLTYKPAYTALKRTVHLLKDPGSPFAPGSLSYSLSGDLTNVHRALLQKRDGRFYLVVWQEVSCWDRVNKRFIPVPRRSITLNLGTPASSVSTYEPNQQLAALRTYTAVNQVALSVPDQLLIVKVTP
jgi:hypothetical protein